MSQLVDLMDARAHGDELALFPLGPLPHSVEGKWASSPLDQAPKRAHHAPTTIILLAPKEEEVTLQEVPLPSGHSEAIAGPLGSSMLPMVLQRGPPVPYHVPQLALSARSFK